MIAMTALYDLHPPSVWSQTLQNKDFKSLESDCFQVVWDHNNYMDASKLDKCVNKTHILLKKSDWMQKNQPSTELQSPTFLSRPSEKLGTHSTSWAIVSADCMVTSRLQPHPDSGSSTRRSNINCGGHMTGIAQLWKPFGDPCCPEGGATEHPIKMHSGHFVVLMLWKTQKQSSLGGLDVCEILRQKGSESER